MTCPSFFSLTLPTSSLQWPSLVSGSWGGGGEKREGRVHGRSVVGVGEGVARGGLQQEG